MAEIDEDGVKNLILDLLSWERYSTLQKLIVLLIGSCVLSWLSSYWTLSFTLFVTFCLGFKLSEQALHHEKASRVAEQVLDKFESVYLLIRGHYYNFKAFLNQVAIGKHGTALYSAEAKDVNNETPLNEDSSQQFSGVSEKISLPNDVGQELNSIQLLILRDFIRSWYADYSYDPQFLKDTKLLLQQTFNSLESRIGQQDPNVTITQVLKLFMIHLTNFQKARNSFQSHKVHPKTKVVTGSTVMRHSSIDEAFESLSSFHCALDSEQAEQEYLKGVMSLFVVCACNSQVIKGVCARTLLVDILSQNIMLPLVKMMCDPVWLMKIVIRVTSYEEKKAESSFHNEVDPHLDEAQNTSLIEKEDIISDIQGKSDIRYKHDISGVQDLNDLPELTDLQNFRPCHEHSEDLLMKRLDAESQDKNERSETEGALSGKVSPNAVPQANLKLLSNTTDATDLQVTNCNILEKHQSAESMANKEDSFGAEGHASDCDQKDISPRVSECGHDIKFIHSSQFSHESEADVGTEALEHFNANNYDFVDLELDPQKIISFTSSEKPTNGNDVSLIKASADPDMEPEHLTQSFPKLSSLKHFFVDTLKPGSKQQQQPAQVAKKPKTLSIISGITSNLNPLASKNSKSSTDVEKRNSSTTPKLLLEGVPVLHEATSADDLPEKSTRGDKEGDWQLTPALSDCDASPAPGFFSNINSLFSFSAQSTRTLNSDSGLDHASSISPLLTPSPTVKDASLSASQDLHSFESNSAWDDMVKSYILDDRRIFQDVSIPETVVNTEYRSSTQYSLYIIHYEALYFSEEGKSIIRSGTVRRRYREFLNLQSRLESQATYKQFLKKIRCPKRWPNLPFKTLEKETVEARRLLLEKYLKDLIEIEAICNSPDIREFLAYEGDSHIAFVKKSPEINVPRLDKMLMRGVSGVVGRIMSIPNNAQEVISGLRSRDTPEDKLGTKPVEQYDTDMFEISYDFTERQEFESSNLLWDSCVKTMEDSCSDEEEDLFNISKVLADQKTTDKMEMVYRQEVEKVLASLPSSKNDASFFQEKSDKTSGSSDLGPGQCEDGSRESLSAAVIDLLVQGLQGTDHWLSHDRVVQSLHAVLGKALNRYLNSSIAKLVSQDQLAFYLLTLRETIWPQGQLWTDSSRAAPPPPPTSWSTATTAACGSSGQANNVSTAEVEEQKRLEFKAKAGKAVGSMFPESVKLAIGKCEFEDLIQVFLDSLQSEELNRNLLYHILDQLLEDLFPEVTTFDLIHDLLFSSLSPSLTMPRLVKEAEKL